MLDVLTGLYLHYEEGMLTRDAGYYCVIWETNCG